MEKGKITGIIIAVALILVMTVPLITGCAPKPVVVGEKGVIKFGCAEDLSGPIAGTMAPRVDGYRARLKYLNEEQGGIDGYKFEMVLIDTKLDPAMTASAWKQLVVGEKVPFILSICGIVFGPLYPEAAKKEKVVFYTGSSNIKYMVSPPGTEGTSWTYGYMPTYPDLYRAVMMFIKDQWIAKGYKYPIKIGFVGMDSEDGRTCAKAMKTWADKDPQTYQIVSVQYVKGNPTDMTTQVMAFKNSGVEAVVPYITDQPWITFVKDCQRLEYKPLVRVGLTTTNSPAVNKVLGPLNDGVCSYTPTTDWDSTDVPLIKLLHDLNAKYYPNTPDREAGFIGGYGMGEVVVEVFKRAGKKVGYDKITGEDLRQAMESAPFTHVGMGPKDEVPFTYTSAWHAGPKIVGFLRYQDGKLTLDKKTYEAPPFTAEEMNAEYWTK